MHQNPMEQYLQNVLSPNNEVRQNAEDHFNNLGRDQLAKQLLPYVNHEIYSQFSCVMLRKIVDEIEDSTAIEVYSHVKNFQNLKQVKHLIASIFKKYDFGFDGLTHSTLSICLEYAPKKFNLDQLMQIVHEKPDVDTFKGFCQYLIAVKPEPSVVHELVQNFITIMTDDYFEPMAEVADYVSTYLVPCYQMYLAKCFEYVAKDNQLALECATLFIEQNPEALKDQASINRYIELLLQWVCQVDLTDEEFANFEEGDAQSNNVVAEMALDRVSRALPESLLPLVLSSVNNMLTAKDWNVRLGAFMCLSSIAEGCVFSLKEELEDVVMLVTKYFKDPHPRVRYGAVHCIGQLATDMAPELSEMYHQVILNGLLETMNDNILRVSTHAANASMNVLEHLPKEESSLYISALMSQYSKLFQSNVPQVQQICIGAVATLADAAESQFVPYMQAIVPQFMEILNSLLTEPLADDNQYELRAKLVECLTLIALAVGRPSFDPFIEPMINILRHLNVRSVDPKSTDPLPSYLLSAWARMCRIIKKDFVPLLQECMPLVLSYASHTPSIEIIEPDEVGNFSQDDGWYVANLESNRVAVNTSQIEEMSTAVEMISIYAETLGSDFAPFANDCVDLCVPLIKFLFSDDVRLSSIRAIPKIVECLNRDQKEAAIPYIVKEYILALQNELDFELTSEFFVGLRLFVGQFGFCLDEEDLNSFYEVCVEMLTKLDENLRSRENELEHVYDEDIVGEDNTLFEMASTLQTLWKVAPDAVLNHYHMKIFPIVAEFLVFFIYLETCQL
eukprot:NODE_60_length_27201_cov_1.043318.p1 type:complete len:790 gc:universal NODE_60_length_27201_cov_1.043318:22901-25270(+)